MITPPVAISSARLLQGAVREDLPRAAVVALRGKVVRALSHHDGPARHVEHVLTVPQRDVLVLERCVHGAGFIRRDVSEVADVPPEQAPLADEVARARAELLQRVGPAVGPVLWVPARARARPVAALHVAVLVDVDGVLARGEAHDGRGDLHLLLVGLVDEGLELERATDAAARGRGELGDVRGGTLGERRRGGGGEGERGERRGSPLAQVGGRFLRGTKSLRDDGRGGTSRDASSAGGRDARVSPAREGRRGGCDCEHRRYRILTSRSASGVSSTGPGNLRIRGLLV